MRGCFVQRKEPLAEPTIEVVVLRKPKRGPRALPESDDLHRLRRRHFLAIRIRRGIERSASERRTNQHLSHFDCSIVTDGAQRAAGFVLKPVI